MMSGTNPRARSKFGMRYNDVGPLTPNTGSPLSTASSACISIEFCSLKQGRG